MSDAGCGAQGQTLVFGIGAQKAGTTWLHNQLARLDGAHLPRPKELHYWDCVRAPYLEKFRFRARERANPGGSDAVLHRLRERLRPELAARRRAAEAYAAIYEARFDDHRPYLGYLKSGDPAFRLLGDVTPSYALLGRAAFAEMLACHPDARFVFMMRDPAERLWSGLRQRDRAAIRKGLVSEADLKRKYRLALADPLDPDRLRSDYARTISELEAAVPAERVRYVFFERLFAGDAEELEGLAAFLGVDPGAFAVDEVVHGGRRGDGDEDGGQAGRGGAPGPEDLDAGAEALAPVYRFVRSRFPDRIPESWRG